MLAGNTGYHFQLLTSVIEVNELQKRRVVGKLEKHLGSLIGKRMALLGLAFKPDTDDMREASSLVLAARLQGEGAEVVAYDPVAGRARRRAADRGRDGRLGAGGAGRAPTPRSWSPSGASSASSTGPRSRRRWPGRCSSTGATSSTPPRCAAAGFEYEGIGQANGRLPGPSADRVMQAIVLVGGEGTRLRPLTDRSRSRR